MRVLLALAVIALSLAVGACGGNGDESSPPEIPLDQHAAADSSGILDIALQTDVARAPDSVAPKDGSEPVPDTLADAERGPDTVDLLVSPDLAGDASLPDVPSPEDSVEPEPELVLPDLNPPEEVSMDLVEPEDTIPGPGGMIEIPAGNFWMGCNEAVDDECWDHEYPYHEVNVPGFHIDQVEVSVVQYDACVQAGQCSGDSSGADYSSQCTMGKAEFVNHPVNCVDWQQAHDYCHAVGKRLCSAAEWEKAARGGCELYDDCQAESPRFPWGNQEATCELAVLDEGGWGCGQGGSNPVGSKGAGLSPYVVADMAGNAAEWVQDCWHIDYKAASDDTYDAPPLDGSPWEEVPCQWDGLRTIRSGSWYYYSEHLRVSFREGRIPEKRSGTVGFRCCK